MRRSASSALAAVASVATVAHAATLSQVCTTSYVQAALPADGFYNGITIDASSVTAIPVTNTSVSSQNMFPGGVLDFCNGKWLRL